MYLLVYMVLGGEEEDYNECIVGSYGIGRRGGGLEYICWFIWYWEERRRIRIYLLAYMVLGREEED